MSYLIDKKQSHETACETAIRGGDTRAAIFHAAKAAEFAYALAESTAGTLAARYIEDAEGWLEIGERLRKEPLPQRSSGSATNKKPLSESAINDSSAPDWLITEKPNITFEMIAGMLDAKDAIFDMVIHPLQDIDKARALNLQAGGGILLYGPPGNGKTLLGKAVANQLDSPFYYASGAQIRSKWHGESEQRLRSLMQAARRHSVAILFLDEVDGLLPRRGGGSVVDNRIVTQFLAEVGGFEQSGNVLLILGATNKPWEIDEAVFRTGRFDEKIYVGLPDRPARLGILHIHLDPLPLEPEFDFEAWTDRLDGYTGSDIVGVINVAKRASLRRSIRQKDEPTLQSADIEAALKTIPSSVTDAMLKQYAKFREMRFG